ncbi:MAG: hypothetical protein IIV80_06295 [Clostridia bacterium]|nr:hypothetical protein [Clostridia bacterium]
MIEFNGKVSKQCRRHIQKQEGLAGLFAGVTVLIIFIIPVIILLIKFLIIPWYITLALCVPFAIFYVAATYFAPFGKSTEKLIIPLRIVISDDRTIASHGEKFHLICSIDDVTMVVDMGEWYHISFGKKLGLGRFVCQKDLLVQGTIEDFEKLFEGKLIRK